MKRVLCIAESCCDLVFGGLSKLPAPGEEIFGSHFSVQPGGGANTAVLLARSGVPTAFWTLLADDFAGRMVRSALQRYGVQLAAHGQKTERTPVSAVLSTKEDRAFASLSSTAELIGDLDVLDRAIGETEIVHTYLGYCDVYPIAALCARHGSLLSVDTSFCDARTTLFETVLPHVDWWKGNESEAMRLTGASNAEDALDAIANRVRRGAVVTCGARGSIGKERGGTILKQAAIPSGPFLDACGAGDAFAAGFLHALARGESLERGMLRGALLSGRVVAAYGGCPPEIDVPVE